MTARPPSRFGQWARAAAVHLAGFLATVVGATVLVQALIALAPGDAIDLLPNAAEVRETLAAEWGLDRPLPERILRSVTGLATGDLGVSLAYRPGAPVAGLVAQTAGQSLRLFAPGLGLGLVLALGLGAWTATRGGTLTRAVQAVSVVPGFLAAFLLVTGLNAGTWALLEAGRIGRPDWFALPDTPSALRTALAVVVLAVASGGLAELHAACDAELGRLVRAPFVEAARARGAPTWPHLLTNVLPPVLDLAASRGAALLGALVVVEKVLLFNGAGALLWQACLQRDVPLAVGVTVAAAAVVAALRLAADLLRIAVDPRLRGAR